MTTHREFSILKTVVAAAAVVLVGLGVVATVVAVHEYRDAAAYTSTSICAVPYEDDGCVTVDTDTVTRIVSTGGKHPHEELDLNGWGPIEFPEGQELVSDATIGEQVTVRVWRDSVITVSDGRNTSRTDEAPIFSARAALAAAVAALSIAAFLTVVWWSRRSMSVEDELGGLDSNSDFQRLALQITGAMTAATVFVFFLQISLPGTSPVVLYLCTIPVALIVLWFAVRNNPPSWFSTLPPQTPMATRSNKGRKRRPRRQRVKSIYS